ncbi:sensor histidine kinase [Rothia aeria]|uniref:sensor histidine kinase n=1 Tax=Rothia aeria TaxID=172042 RepID=UPI001F2B1CD2|nr:histidine kinase [Rothia aeria]
MPTENVAEPILRMYTDPQSSSAPQPSSVPQPGPAPTHPGPISPEPMSSRPSHLKPLSTQNSGQDYNPPGRGQTILLMAGIYIRAIYEVYVFALFCIVISLCLMGIGFVFLPFILNLMKFDAEAERNTARHRAGVEVIGGYKPVEDGKNPLSPARNLARLGDSLVLRDILWHFVNVFVGTFLGVIPTSLFLSGVWGVALMVGQHYFVPVFVVDPGGSHYMDPGGSHYMFLDMSTPNAYWYAGTLGIIQILLAFIIARPLLRTYGYWVQLVLGRSSELVLRERISHLTDTRNDALDFQQDEISRIERDLHDGVQAHLVSMGMTLNEVAALMQEDPERAQQMLSQAQNSSVTALQELRGLVRGIRPPLLADRGLNEAVRSLCTSTSVPTTFTSTLTGRLPEPLETALYFAAAELVTNAVKHANAQKITVGITQGESLIMLEVQDDGTGGIPQDALGSKASGGLEGIRRRLATFDGEMFVSSPAEGPTSVRAIVPYAAPAPQQH